MVELLAHSPLALFIVQAVLIIGVARGLGLLARLGGQPMVIAEVAAGIMLGPSLLGWLWPAAKAAVFPKESLGLLQMFSQVGLVLFMFLIGLELDPKVLRGRGRAALLISQAGIVVPFAMGALLAFVLRATLLEAGVPLGSFMMFMGTSMCITAFPVLARILSERRMMQTKVGAIAITSAAIGDVTAWCLLAFVVSTVTARGLNRALQTVGLTALYIALMFVAVRPFMRRFGALASSREGLTQDVVAGTFLLLLGSSWATEVIGIHALFGAFVLGVIIPREGGFATLLTDKLEDFVVVFLLPMFFAYSGLRTQIGLLDSQQAWVLCGVIIAVACAGKFGGSLIAARLCRLSWRESATIGVLMNARGLMELIVLNIGLDLGVISPTLFTMLVLMALATTLVTTPLLQLFYRPEQQLLPSLGEQAEPLGAPADRFCVLVCVSYTGAGPGMLKVSETLVRRSLEHSRLYALKLQRPTDRPSFYLDAGPGPRQSDSGLEPLVEQAEGQKLQVRPISFVSAQPARDICNVAEVKGADLVLLGWHRPLFNRAALGGTVSQVLSEATTTVGVVVDRGLQTIRRVLVPFHGTEHDRAALRLAQRMATQSGISITVLHVVKPGELPSSAVQGLSREMTELFHEPGSPGGEVAVKVVEHTDPAEAALVEAASDQPTPYDLVLIGLGADWGLEQRQFGLNQEYFIRKCRVSLLVLRAPEARKAGRARAAKASQTTPN